MKHFYQILLNTLIANVTTSYLWFALTFWVYLETKSVLATGIIGGAYMLLVAIFSIIFGTIVDHNKKKNVMVFSAVFSLVCFALGGLVYLSFDKAQLLDWTGPIFWLFTMIILIGGVIENMRNIALSTVVTILVPKENHDKANGMVGTVQGVAFMVTSVFSGLSIGLLGMGWTLAIAIAFTTIAALHILFVSIPEKKIVHDPELENKKIDLKGSIAAIRVVPGLAWLIVFTTFNNLVGGVFMALMDPYGLTLFPVELWGVVLGVTSIGFIIGGGIVAKKGLGKNPLKTMLLVNIGVALLGGLFTIREWWWLYALGMLLFMCLMPIAEAAEQTIIQRVVPLKRQGRVFGLAQAIESASAPITAFIVAPIAQFAIIPYMRSLEGKQAFGWLLGDGQARGIALVFVVASLIMLMVVLYAFRTRAYQRLSEFYQKA
ncbi:MAG TPA: MFS transporter [Candidatus Saccharimonadales bacterium]|nr:MFS transporter [Candidatus Saccharimonadales bacterium]